MIVIATTEQETAGVIARLGEFGVRLTEVVAPGADRRVVLAEVGDEWEAERLVAVLRAEGLMVAIRPDRGMRLEAWKQRTDPVVFDGRLSVCLVWSDHDRGDLPGLIELGHGGFGNAHHPSTRMLIEELVGRITGGERVLDVGCGSGVLGLCALQLGAAQVVAVDLKADAVDSARHNAALNGMDGSLEATVAPLGEIADPFDVVVANIARAGVVELASELVASVSPDGWLAVSGISPSQCSQVAEFLRPLIEVGRRTCGEWSALVLANT